GAGADLAPRGPRGRAGRLRDRELDELLPAPADRGRGRRRARARERPPRPVCAPDAPVAPGARRALERRRPRLRAGGRGPPGAARPLRADPARAGRGARARLQPAGQRRALGSARLSAGAAGIAAELLLEPLDGQPDAFLELDLRPPPQLAKRLVTGHILAPEVAGPLGPELDADTAAEDAADALRHLQHRDLARALEVVGLLRGHVLHREQVGLGHVPDVDELPILVAPARDGQGLAAEGLLDEDGDEELLAHPGAVRDAVAEDREGHAVELAVVVAHH